MQTASEPSTSRRAGLTTVQRELSRAGNTVSRDTTLLPVWPRFGSSAKFPSGRGHHFPAPCGRDVGPLAKLSCRARLCLPVAVARLAGRWCFWRLLVFVAGLWVSGCLVSFFRGRRPEDRSEGVGIKEGVPLLLGPERLLRWSCHSMSSCDGVRPITVRASADLPEGVTYTPHEGSSQATDTRHQPENWQHTLAPCIRSFESAGRRQVYVHRDGSFYLCIVTGATLRRHLTRCRGSRISLPCRCGDFGFVSRHKPAEHRFPDVSATPDVEASCITSCCGRRVFLSERRCGVPVCLQSRRRQPVLLCFFLRE